MSNNNIKPGPCSYEYEFGADALEYLALQETIEISSMSVLSGLALQAQLDANKGALMAVGQTETRHEAWALIDIWKVSPFAGASDTSFPYANQILDLTNKFVVPGTCPSENPPYPTPNQHLPQINTAVNTTGFAPGDTIEFEFSFDPGFEEGTKYYAVYAHGVFNISVPFDTQTNLSTIPKEFESRGMIVAVVADEIGAPSQDSVVAGPLLLFEQPMALNTLTS